MTSSWSPTVTMLCRAQMSSHTVRTPRGTSGSLVIVAIALGIVGVVAKGLLYLLIIGIAVFLGALLLAALRMRRRPGKHPARSSHTSDP